MALDTQAIVDAVVSHAAASGHFERVNQHEPISSPGTGLTAAVWVNRAGPAPAAGGLAATSVRLELMLRIYTPANQEPRDAIDPQVMAAVDKLMADFSGDFELGGEVRNVDLLGAHGAALHAEAGYVEPTPGDVYRVMTITLPVILNDVWTQSP